MALPRIIPVLLLDVDGLIKTTKYKHPIYLGDPINAVKIFNDKLADEVIILDVTATQQRRKPNYELLEDIGTEAFMPFAYGGGINEIEDAVKILKAGAEKIIINSVVFDRPDFVKTLSEKIGSSSTVVSIDIKKNLFGKYKVFTKRGKSNTNLNPFDHARRMIDYGAGEIFVNNIDLDGMMSGYEVDFIRTFAEALDVPVVCCGGAKDISDVINLFKHTQVSGCAAGSMFVYNGPLKGFLISYPNVDDLIEKLNL